MLQPLDVSRYTNGQGMGQAASPFPVPTPKQITTLVQNYELYAESLRKRMEDDWELLVLTPFNPGEGYEEYTSNEPMVYFDKLMAVGIAGQLKFRIPTPKSQREKRERESIKERFILGILKANDERLSKLGEPPLFDALWAYINLRGWYCGRALLVKDLATGQSYPDITAWDPMHVSWGVGSRGLKWICHKMKKTPAEIREEYEFNVGGLSPGDSQASAAESYFNTQMVDDSTGVDVYDWYDEYNNIVVIGDEYAKPPTAHGGNGTVPAFFGAVGALPLIQSRTLAGKDNLVHRGESIFAANRRLYNKFNQVLSTMLQLVELSRNQAYLLYSPDGTKTLKNNPSLTGALTPLSTEDRLEILPLLEMSKDTGAFLGLLSGEIQRGALPYSVYGQLAFQLSGYAVNLLKQATESPIVPRQRAAEICYWQISNLVSDQFASGVYDPMQLRGIGQNRDFFDEIFYPEMISGLPSPEVTLSVKTPQDDMAKMQLAMLASQGPWPALSWRRIWDDILEIQDTDALEDEIKEQVGERLLPEAALMVLMNAMERQGRPELAQLYQGKLIKVAMMDQAGPPGADGSGSGGNKSGVSPQNLSAPEQGAPTPQPTPQQGPNVPPNSPRPGAQEAA